MMYQKTETGTLRALQARSGRVVLDRQHQHYRGARLHSNNTGEMTALLRAIEMASDHPERVEFRVDSTYAIHIATGKFRLPAPGKGNWELAARLRNALRRLQLAKGHDNVNIVHVRSHTGHVGNEVADILAKEGTELNEEMARNWVYLDEVERRMFAHAQPQHRKAARRK